MNLINISKHIGVSDTEVMAVPAGEVWTVFVGSITTAQTSTAQTTVRRFDASENDHFDVLAKVAVSYGSPAEFPQKIVLESGDKLLARINSGTGACVLGVSKVTAVEQETFNWRGTHVPGASYNIRDVVNASGTLYISTQSGNTQTPPATQWDAFVSKGTPGDLTAPTTLPALIHGTGTVTYSSSGKINTATIGAKTIDQVVYSGSKIIQWREKHDLANDTTTKTYAVTYDGEDITAITEVV